MTITKNAATANIINHLNEILSHYAAGNNTENITTETTAAAATVEKGES